MALLFIKYMIIKMNICEQIKKIILEQMQDAFVVVSDPQDDGTHLEAIVVSNEFSAMSLVGQHRRVMNLLKESFNKDLHALKLKTYSFEKWEQSNGGEL
ncbi:MAG: hypothetical protein S4CHLAM6_14070 [Chlamydiae bacterium]|nr:hypothetical protein [Chlamydiota bacterium]